MATVLDLRSALDAARDALSSRDFATAVAHLGDAHDLAVDVAPHVADELEWAVDAASDEQSELAETYLEHAHANAQLIE